MRGGGGLGDTPSLLCPLPCHMLCPHGSPTIFYHLYLPHDPTHATLLLPHALPPCPLPPCLLLVVVPAPTHAWPETPPFVATPHLPPHAPTHTYHPPPSYLLFFLRPLMPVTGTSLPLPFPIPCLHVPLPVRMDWDRRTDSAGVLRSFTAERRGVYLPLYLEDLHLSPSCPYVYLPALPTTPPCPTLLFPFPAPLGFKTCACLCSPLACRT